MKQRRRRSSGCTSPHIHLPRRRDPGRRARRDPRVQRRPGRRRLSSSSTRRPPQIDFEAALLEIDPDKDVDGLHPVNLGRLALVDARPGAVHARGHRGAARALRDPGRRPRGRASSAAGITLGRPLALLLSQKRPTANAAVTVVHTGVPDWPRYTRRADIVVAAAGVPGILQPEHITPGAVVVGGGVRYEGRKLLPDVDERVRGGRRLRSRPASAASARPRSRCCSATWSRPPSATRRERGDERA